jgi:transcriptional regulator with XRE-family HTH domain
MPKETRNKKNPLRQLRGLLATPGRERISQKELAQLLGISPNTIRKIEFGSRSLTDAVLTEVKVATGAKWDRERRRWTQLEEKLFTHEDYTEHRRRMLNPSDMDQAIQKSMVVLIHCRIEWLFDNVPEKSREKLRSRVDYFLERCKRDFKLTSNDASFYTPWGSSPDSDYARFMKLAQEKRELMHQKLMKEREQEREHLAQNIKRGEQKHEHVAKKPQKGSYAASDRKKAKPLYLYPL